MFELNETVSKFENLPLEYLAIILGLAAIALAAFAIHAVLTVIKRSAR